MSDQKPFASLSSSLLARKGGAKPAMRRQGFSSFPDRSSHNDEETHDDLGWNDMGYDVDPDHDAHPVAHVHHNPLAGAILNPGASVRQQQEEIAAKLGATPADDEPVISDKDEATALPVPLSSAREVVPVADQSVLTSKDHSEGHEDEKPTARSRKAKTAFTLRLDPDRHLKLRLASAVKNVSAQQLVTRALDEYLRSVPELDDLAERVPSRGAA
ncbi:hypothetical protein [Parasphingorhabdus sp.]|uniref:hypothetical protein n=1 Tax=Parasphingorhabdus sp. TaxID=2709688 RepID=UPI003A8F23B8